MEIREDEEKLTEEQRRRAEANRAAALAKRKAILSRSEETAKPWKLFKCSKPTANFPFSKQPEIVKQVEIPQKFLARLEICSPDSFSVFPLALKGFKFPGEQVCFEKLTDCLSNVVSSHCTQNTGGGKACVYKLGDYQCVLRNLKSCAAIQCEEIPWATLNVIERLSHSYFAGKWIPCRPEHLPDETVDELIAGLPKALCNALLPFQLDGLRFGLRRGGRCLIADEMGLGKTLQAIAIAGCFMKEGSILVVCPAILRYSWAEELERWFPYCLPTNVHLVFGHQDNPARLPKQPRVVVTSYRMLNRLHKSMLQQEWATLIVDESHHLHCTKSSSEKDELKAVLDVAMKVKHLILLSGTPSLSRPYDIFHQINMLWPGLLGKTKYDFAKTYCDLTFIKPCQGKAFTDYSKGKRLEELNVLLKQSVMIRRLKEHVLPQLPPKRRKIINLVLRRSDINLAAETLGIESVDASVDCVDGNSPVDEDQDTHMKKVLSTNLSALGIAKLPGFFEWLSIHPIMMEVHGEESREESSGSRKMIIFCYHHKVLDGVQAFLCEAGIQFVRIDCNVTGSDRQSAIQTFQYSKEVRIALIGIRSGGSGLNLTAADNVVFLELPLRPADIQQAEDRAHRHGQKKLVNIYIFCAKDTVDESHWRRLNKSLLRVSSTVNGKHGVMREIEIESVSYLETTGRLNGRIIPESTGDQNDPRDNFMKFQDSSSNQDLHSVSSCGDSIVNIYGGEQEDHNIISSLKSRPQVEVDTTLPQTSSNDNGKAVEIVSAVNCSFQDILRFEVSRYTGRIHLYTCISGPDYRPQPLFENFRQEEVEFHRLSKENEKMTDEAFTDNHLYRKACMTFIAEWNKLTPIDKKKLTGKPLQLPLSCELWYLNESHNHDNGGLLKGGSKRRKTPRAEISCPLPSNADWRKVSLCSRQGQKEIHYLQGWSDLDEPLCKLCQTPCKSKNAKVPQFFEDLFCSLDCFEEYRYRTSNRFLRQELFKIEKGVCTNCRLDCHGLVKHLKPLSLKIRQAYIERQAPIIATHNKLLDKLVRDPSEGNAWHADHIIPVYKGGGECKLENMRTLCVACHASVTSEQCAERRIARKEAKKRLKDIMNGLINVPQDHDLNFPEKEEDHNLLLDIPGSAYSITNHKEIDGRNEKANPCLNSHGSEALQLSLKEKASQELENPSCDPESDSNNCNEATGNTANEEHIKLLKSVQIVYTESGQALKVSEYGKIDDDTLNDIPQARSPL